MQFEVRREGGKGGEKLLSGGFEVVHRRTKCTLENNIRLFPSVYVRFQILQKCVLHGTGDYSV